MAVVPGSQRTALNDATPVTAVPAPSAGTYRHVICLYIAQIDAVAQDITVSRVVSATSRQYKKRAGLAANADYYPIDREHPVILDSTMSITVQMGGAKNTTEPDAHAEWIDFTP